MTTCMALRLRLLAPVHMCAQQKMGNTRLPSYDCPAEETNNVNTQGPVKGLGESHNTGLAVPAEQQ